METGLIRKIAFGAESAAVPTMPAAGGNINWAAVSNTWDTIGSKEDGDIASLADGTVSITPREESVEDDPPLSQNREGETVFKNGVDNFTFDVYSVTERMRALSSTARTVSNMTEETTSIIYRAAIIEVTGIGCEYFPKVRVKLGGLSGGQKEHATLSVDCKVFAGSLGGLRIPSGSRWYGFNG